tara:strand:+ start:1351 stop:1926 length:576 start_codon:yes stop_codon:yes gene_type:complete
MYTINQSLNVNETAGSTPIAVGINENCLLKGLTKKTDKNGNAYLSIQFTDANGNELNHNEFDINPQYVTPKEGESKEDAVARRVNNMLIRIKHICTQFVPKDQFSVSGNNFGELCDGIVALMANANTSTPVRLKVVYDYKDYSSLPNYTPFIEPMTKTPSGLKMTQYDKLEKTSASAESQAASTDDTGLPF